MCLLLWTLEGASFFHILCVVLCYYMFVFLLLFIVLLHVHRLCFAEQYVYVLDRGPLIWFVGHFIILPESSAIKESKSGFGSLCLPIKT